MTNTESVSSILSNLFAKDDSTSIATEEFKADLLTAHSTGLTVLDLHIGGGLFDGRIYEFFGEESAGKSTLGYSCLASYQSENPRAVAHIVETESAIDKVRCQAIGMDMSRTLISEADLVNEGFERIKSVGKALTDEFIRVDKKATPRIIHMWDTIAAAATVGETTGELFKGGIGEKPRLIRAALRAITGVLAEQKSPLILINQVYDSMEMYGGVVSPGGRGLRHHSSVRLLVKKKSPIMIKKEDGSELKIGNMVEVRIVKNKVAMPDLTFQLAMHSQNGFQEIKSLVSWNVDLKPSPYITKGGSGWCKLTLPGWIPVDDKFRIISFRSTEIEDKIRNSKFLLELMRWLAYHKYTEDYPLMKIKYRVLLWQKMINALHAWNKEFQDFNGTSVDKPELKYPKPDIATQDELREINEHLSNINSISENYAQQYEGAYEQESTT